MILCWLSSVWPHQKLSINCFLLNEIRAQARSRKKFSTPQRSSVITLPTEQLQRGPPRFKIHSCATSLKEENSASTLGGKVLAKFYSSAQIWEGVRLCCRCGSWLHLHSVWLVYGGAILLSIQRLLSKQVLNKMTARLQIVLAPCSCHLTKQLLSPSSALH